MLALVKAWTWLKNYWYFPLLIIVAIGVLLKTRNTSVAKKILEISRYRFEQEKTVLAKAAQEKKEKPTGIGGKTVPKR